MLFKYGVLGTAKH